MGPMSFVARDTAFSRCQSDQSNDGVRFINSERMAPTVTVDPAALVSREGTREMIRINTGSEVILHAAHVLPAGVCGTSYACKIWIWASSIPMPWTRPLRFTEWGSFNLKRSSALE